jgi:mycothiol system anti-sigma-R factor
MRCEEVIARLFAYLDGEIGPETRAEIDRHLQSCRGCYSRAEFEKTLQAKLRQAGGEKAPAALKLRLQSLLDEF